MSPGDLWVHLLSNKQSSLFFAVNLFCKQAKKNPRQFYLANVEKYCDICRTEVLPILILTYWILPLNMLIGSLKIRYLHNLHTLSFRSHKKSIHVNHFSTKYGYLWQKEDYRCRKEDHRSRKSSFQNVIKTSTELDQNDA